MTLPSGAPPGGPAAAALDAPARPVTTAGRRNPWGRLGLHLTLAIIAIIWLSKRPRCVQVRPASVDL